MDSAKLNDWLQIIGMLGIIASLVFVGLQVNQTQRVGEGEEIASFVELSTNMRTLFIEHADVWRKACAGEELSAEGQTKAAMLYKAYTELAYNFGAASRAGISQSSSQFLINRFAANIHRYPGFAELAATHNVWTLQGERGRDIEDVRLFAKAITARLAVLKEIEPDPDFDVKWCGI
jgi:hypothetical protein